MDFWDLRGLDVEPHQPKVLRTDAEARVVAINLPAGEALEDHQVHERAYVGFVDPSRKRKIRLVVALSAAVLLATALVVVSFSAGTSQLLPSEALAQKPDDRFELGATVVDGSLEERGDSLAFAIQDPNGSAQIPVTYSGAVPDPFREGREVLVKGELEGGHFVGNEMTTK